MPNQLPLAGQIILDRPQARRPLLGYLTMLAALLSVGGAVWAWQAGYRPPFLAAQRSDMSLDLVEVDQGDVIEYVVENGTLESATNTVVRCEVEALMGMVGGTSGAGGAAGSSRSGTTGEFGIGPKRFRNHRNTRRKQCVGWLRERRRFSANGHHEGQVEGGNQQEEFGILGRKQLRFFQRQRIFQRQRLPAAARQQQQFVGQFLDGVIRHQQRLGKAEHSQLQLHGRAAHAAAWLQHKEHDHDRSEKQPGSDDRWWRRRTRWWRRRWQRRSGWPWWWRRCDG